MIHDNFLFLEWVFKCFCWGAVVDAIFLRTLDRLLFHNRRGDKHLGEGFSLFSGSVLCD